MGYGDELIGSGLARGAAARGKRVAFGDGHTILWRRQAFEIFQDNPNVARPGEEQVGNLEWIAHYRGHRLYATQGLRNGAWQFNLFKCIPGEVFLTKAELREGRSLGRWDVVIEPNVKPVAPNKQWSPERYQVVASMLMRRGLRVCQIGGNVDLKGVQSIYPATFRHAMVLIKNARVYIGPEGGLHHACAAMETDAVVLFGGFISPAVTGYANHINLTGTDEPCGLLKPCEHCRKAMNSIQIETVISSAEGLLNAQRN